jgi:hypothetical protein
MIFVPAATAADLLVDSFVVCVLVALLFAVVVAFCSIVVYGVVASFSALPPLFVATPGKKVKPVVYVPYVIEILDDDEVSSSEEEDDDDEVVILEVKAAPRRKKTVSFGTVQVQEYSLTLGDLSLCNRYPLSLDWAHAEPKEYDLDALEAAKKAKGAAKDFYIGSKSDRLERISAVTGIRPETVQKAEHMRRKRVEAEHKEAALKKEQKRLLKLQAK